LLNLDQSSKVDVKDDMQDAASHQT